MNKNIVFTLTNGLGTINVSEDSILYMHQNNDSAVGGYVLSVDEDKDRETIYVVDEDIATMEAAASKMFSVTLSTEDQALSINANRVVDLSSETWDVYLEGGVTNGVRLVGDQAVFASAESIPGVEIGDTITTSGPDFTLIILSFTSTKQVEVDNNFGALIFNNVPWKIYKGQNSTTRIYYRGIGVDLDTRSVSESTSDIQTLVNAL